MTAYLPRTVLVEQDKKHTSQSPSDLRLHHAYILLGDAGMGKSRLFKAECDELGNTAIYCTIQDFLDFDENTSPDELAGKTLFIDGLDEARNRGDQTITSALRKLLNKLGRPRFRLSCRAAEWFSQTDQNAFSALLPTGETLPIAHLQPFNRSDVTQYLREKNINAEAFIEQADSLGLSELLFNPQTLNMLIAAVDSQQGWPHSKMEVFELACRKLAEEHNQFHQQRNAHPVDDLLNAAGYWYAVMLLSGRRSTTLNLPDSEDRLSLSTSPGFATKTLPLEPVLRSRLFQGDGKDEYFYTHRSVAEFLAARYINQRLTDGLPLLRIWSLLCGVDGGVISNLRGLYGWLASLANLAHHREVIAKDPIALLVYGDARHFSRESKILLIDALRQHIRQHPDFRNNHEDASHWINESMAALATPYMEDVFRSYFEQLDDTEEKQQLAGCLLNAIEYGSNLPTLQTLLIGIVRNDQNWGGVRRYAMQALLAHEENVAVCLDLLEAFRSGAVNDPDREMVGSILTAYYPNQVEPGNVLQYFLPERSNSTIGFYRFFWSDTLVKKTHAEALPELISQATKIDRSSLDDWHGRYEFDEMLGKLFAEALTKMGATLSISTLSQWLLDDLNYSQRQPAMAAINAWAKKHPPRYQELVIHTLRTAQSDSPLGNFWSIWHRIERPEWFWSWVIVAISKDEFTDVRIPLFELAKCGLYRSVPYDLNDLYDLTQTYPELSGRHNDLYSDLTENDWQIRDSRSRLKQQAKEKKRKRENRQAIHAIRKQMADGTAEMHYLDWLARQYWQAFPQGLNKEQTQTPLEIITAELDSDDELAQLSIQALGQALQRSDLPSQNELIQLQQDGYSPRSFWVCMAAARECHLISPEHFLALDDDKLSLLAAMLLIGLQVPDIAWHETLLANRPDIVSQVYLHYLTRMLPVKQHINGAGSLSKDDRYAEVARQLLPVLFQQMPEDLSDLGWDAVRTLWLAGIKTAETTNQRNWLSQQLAKEKVGRKRRANLLAMALALDPAAYEQFVINFIGSKARQRLLARAITLYESGRRLDLWSDNLLTNQIECLGAIYPLPVFDDQDFSLETNISQMIDNMIGVLSRRTNESATTAIAALQANPTLEKWQRHFRIALSHQQKNRRHATFQTQSPDKVVATLNAGAPSNHADLQALVIHELTSLAKQIRDGSEGMYKHFWNEDKNGKVTTPKIENSDRDVLLAILKERFARQEISLIEERQYADTKRADISFEYAKLGIRLPIEIKRSSNKEIWTAVTRQLVPRYTRDPGSMGYGIYLVLWFGPDKVQSPPKPLHKPTSAPELQQMLEDGLTESERPLIKICVMDVAKPA